MNIEIGKRNTLEINDNSELIVVAPFGRSKADDFIDYYDYAMKLHSLNPHMLHELTTVFPFDHFRKRIISDINIPYGTVFAYEFVSNCLIKNAKSKKEIEYILKQTLNNQLDSGIDYFTLHASLNTDFISKNLNSINNRTIKIPSRAGSMLLSLMKSLKIDNPLHTHINYIAKMAAETGTAISLGSTFRAGAISDCMDSVHICEIYRQKQLVEICNNYGLSNILLEGFGHGLPQEFEQYCALVKKELPSIPITALGPLPVDSAIGFDDVAASIGIVLGRQCGLSLVNIVTCKEHVSLPDFKDCKQAISYAKLGGRIGDVIKTGKDSINDKELSLARKNLDWKTQIDNSIIPEMAESLLGSYENGTSCSICESNCPHKKVNL